MQAGHRVLEDHPDLTPAYALKLAVPHPGQIAVAEPHGAACDSTLRPRQEAHDRECCHRLARARLSDHSERATFLDREAHPIDGAQDPCPQGQLGAQIFDL